jgi:hypothetical protein
LHGEVGECVAGGEAMLDAGDGAEKRQQLRLGGDDYFSAAI